MRTLVSTVSLCLCVTSLGTAQGIVGPLSLSAGAGLEIAHVRDNTTWTPGITLHAAVTLQPATSRLGLRVAGWWYDRRRETPSFFSRAQAAGLGLEGRYDLRAGATRAYLFAGGGSGWFYTALGGTGPTTSESSAFVTAGTGIERRLGPVSAFAEVRLVHPIHGDGFGTYFAPLGLGVRF